MGWWYLSIALSLSFTRGFPFESRSSMRGDFLVKSSPLMDLSVQSLTLQSVLIAKLIRVTPDQAQRDFYFFLLGGSGALGIGFAQIPKIFKQIEEIRSLSATSDPRSGENLQCNPLATIGYPRELKKKDVADIMSNLPDVDTISRLGKKSSFLSQKGYLERDAFIDSFPSNFDKLAIYAAFSCFSGGSNLASPDKAESVMNRWKQSQNTLACFSSDLLGASIAKLSSYVVFFSLIIVTLDLIIESGQMAFFP